MFYTHLVSGLEECHTKSDMCKDSSVITEAYHCHLKGRFPHPTNANLYLLCPDVGFKACLCHCKYEQMCFDITKSSCKFEFLGDIVDCTRPLPISAYSESFTKIIPSNTDYTSDDPNTVVSNNSWTASLNTSVQLVETTSNQKDTQGVKYDGVFNTSEQHLNFSVNLYVEESDHEAQSKSTQQQTTTMSQTNTKSSNSIAHTGTGFPTWMFSLVILCVVILIVLIILYAY